jgi:hypothetical protein
VATAASAWGDGPPPGHTGGFREPTCLRCHADKPVDDPLGAAAILGLPDTFEPGETYELLVAITRPGLVRAGFQLAARSLHADSSVTQAGTFRVTGPALTIVRHERIEYLQHTSEGTQVARPDTAVWTVGWMAPLETSTVTFHLAANATNDDASEFGDFIYLVELRVYAARR